MVIPVPSAIVKVTSFVVNLICSFIVPCVANVAYKLRIGDSCDCPSSPPHHVHRGRQHKKLKGHTAQNNDIKRIKLLVDITVGHNGSKVLDIQASARGQDRIPEEIQCKKNPGIILRLLNLPSSIMLYFVDKIRQIAHDLDAVNNPCKSCIDDRIKKSPKRRITRYNYRKIIPFFPFNLLGFSNYSAFQMPSITNSCTSTAEDYNNLNASTMSTGNGKTICKRRRNSTSDESFEVSDDDVSLLECTEKSNKGSSYYSAIGGVDEVDSDEASETVTKRMTSSSSSNGQNHQELDGNETAETITNGVTSFSSPNGQTHHQEVEGDETAEKVTNGMASSSSSNGQTYRQEVGGDETPETVSKIMVSSTSSNGQTYPQEVDCDETAETVTKGMASSSSSNGQTHHQEVDGDETAEMVTKRMASNEQNRRQVKKRNSKHVLSKNGHQ